MIVETLSLLEVKLLIPFVEILQLILVTFSSWHFGAQYYPQQAVVNDGQTFDFIIIGAGSAGCVLANRLTEVSNWTVLLIEAGDDPPRITTNPGMSSLVTSSLPEWGYYTVDDGHSSQARKTRNIKQTTGKMIGGSSELNYMFYVRGNKRDYENWVDLGNDGWDWATVINYFKKSERLHDNDIMKSESAVLHSSTGCLGVTRHQLTDEKEAFFKAVKELDHTVHEDTNGFEQLGYSSAQFTVDNGERQSTALAFLKPIKDRPNLHIIKNTKARKILIDDNKKAVGVEIHTRKGMYNVYAQLEVILSAGAINSPQLLMLSGVGPKKHLEDMRINIVLDSPKVGENLQDHIIVPVVFTALESISSIFYNLKLLKSLDSFPVPTIIGFATVNKSQNFPDYQATVVPVPTASILPTILCSQLFMLEDHICMAMASSGKWKETVFGLLSYLHPESRGRVELKSSSPEDKPIIHTGFFRNEEDLTKFALCMEDYLRIVNTTHYRELSSQIVDLKVEQCEGLTFASFEYWKCYILNVASTQFHPVGTCAMGPEGNGVVDTRLRVHGIKNLRIVDASVIPSIPSGNTNAPVIMVAEKAADMIKYDNGIFENWI